MVVLYGMVVELKGGLEVELKLEQRVGTTKENQFPETHQIYMMYQKCGILDLEGRLVSTIGLPLESFI